MLRIDRERDNRVIRAFTHKLADIPNGITVSAADLTQKVLHEGTPVGKDANGLYHVVKTARLHEDATAETKDYKVKKDHHFKVGDFVMLKAGAKAYKITKIDTSEAAFDKITVETTLGEEAKVASGAVLVQAAAESADTASAFKYEPVALVGESYDVDALSNHIVNAVTIGQVRASNIPALGADVKAKLTGIQFI